MRLTRQTGRQDWYQHKKLLRGIDRQEGMVSVQHGKIVAAEVVQRLDDAMATRENHVTSVPGALR